MELLLALHLRFNLRAVIFKIFKIPVNEWSLSTAALGGIMGIFLLLLVMNYTLPVHDERPNLFCSDPNIADRKGACG